MVSSLFHDLLFQPLYNGLVFLISVMPAEDIGLAVVVLTIIVKFLILPLSHKTIKAQSKMKELEPHINEIREKHKNNKQEQALKTMELYRKHGVNPLSGLLSLFIQFPIILALYFVFWKGLKNGINPAELYSFIIAPETLNTNFLGIFDLSGRHVVLAAIAALSQYLQFHTATPAILKKPTQNSSKPSFQEEFMKSFTIQMKYGLPVVIFVISYSISGVIALYWAVSNFFTVVHQLYVRHKAKRMAGEQVVP